MTRGSMSAQPHIQPDDHDLQPALGARLKAIRTEKGLPLAGVARATGISRSFLSLVESGANEISVSRLMRLLRHYEVHISELIADISEGDYDLIRRDELRELPSPAEDLSIYLLSRDERRSMLPMIVEMRPGGGHTDVGRHPGEECIHVLAGTVHLVLEPDSEVIELFEGDTAWYSGERGHTVVNGGDTTARIFAVVSPPNF
ncbi:helix-turn-helix domain-containing protein [Gordonia sp. NPDC127522]|uniref:helix-turn-helix domain-containing protein n=1 Tax=Gordonia sp. NPDC127522 TaxID=3345390 RepID=UPI003633F43C